MIAKPARNRSRRSRQDRKVEMGQRAFEADVRHWAKVAGFDFTPHDYAAVQGSMLTEYDHLPPKVAARRAFVAYSTYLRSIGR
jgi:hypothetical protein